MMKYTKYFLKLASLQKIVVLGFILSLQMTAHALEYKTTLDKIKGTNTIIIGHRESSVPFAYYDNQQNVVGYGMDYADYIIAAIKDEFNLPDLQVKYMPVNVLNRLALLQNWAYDLECGSTANDAVRQKVVSFGNSFFISKMKVLVSKDSGFKSIDDLKAQNVAVTAGTLVEKRLQQINQKHNLNMRILSLKDHGDSFRALESGRAVAFVMDEPLLAGEKARAKDPNKWEIVGDSLFTQPYACMFRKDDPEFEGFLKQVVTEYQTSGKAEISYNKWFNAPIPPRNVSLEMPINEEMKQLFADPNNNNAESYN